MKTLFGHPRGLAILFGTEMWERLSYYGMRALLVGYLTKYLLLPGHVEGVLFYAPVKAFFEALAGPLSPQPFASLLYGTYTGLVYATPLLGGWLADRWFGQRAVAITGMLLMAAGHFMMASEALLFPALTLLIFGGGFFKTNTSSQVGFLYKPDDPARDSGYAIFYVGVNVGGFLGPLVCGGLGELVGWHYGFAAAGFGLLCALAIYFAGWRSLPADKGRTATSDEQPRPLSREEWKSITALLLLLIPLTLYWACNEQWGNTLTLWSIDNTDKTIDLFGWHAEIPWTWFQSLNPLVIFFGTPFLLSLWKRQGARQPGTARKMFTGCVLMAAANLLMVLPALMGGQTSWLWLAGYYVIMTMGEIHLYPVGLSLFSKAAPVRMASLMMGFYFVPNFVGGGFLQGWLGTFWEKMDKAAFFAMIAGVAALAAVIIRLLERPLRPVLEDAA
jgi:POT family proton-dependent oligopeptide transporter